MRRLKSGVIAILLLAAPAAVGAQTPGYEGVGLFEMPALTTAERQVERLAAQGDLASAAALLDQLLKRYGGASRLHADRAVILAAQGQNDPAFDALAKAASLGLPNLEALLAASPLSGLGADPRMAALIAAAPRPQEPPAPPPPTRIDSSQAPVSAANTFWNPNLSRLVSRFEMLPGMRRFPLADGKPEGPMAELQVWVARGRAAGNVGDLYDNRDSGHSALSHVRATQISHVVYPPEAQAAGLHYGLNSQILFDAPTIGNSSTATTGGALWRSQGRLALTSPEGAARLWQLYVANHLYIFPEHMDYDPINPPEGATGPEATPGRGDVIPANTPYMLITQGSSGSDRPALRATMAILAAFQPKVKTFLKERGLIAPTIQQIFRRGQTGIETDETYLSPIAHPVVFDARRIDLGRMIALANALKVEEAPPVVLLSMEEDAVASSVHGLLFPDSGFNERLFDSPSAIARVWRGEADTRRYVLSAAATQDPNGRPLRFHWVVTQGAAANVDITPLDDAGSRVEVVLRWATPKPTALRKDILSPRTDIAVIADNGAELSAPAFFSMLYPAHQARIYDATGLEKPVLQTIDHASAVSARRYFDPLIWPQRNWIDQLDHNAQGKLVGWTRKRGEVETRFTADGRFTDGFSLRRS
ncbi:MAG: hypothetical protein WD969_13270, partial [Paracoccaceae bacterium]